MSVQTPTPLLEEADCTSPHYTGGAHDPPHVKVRDYGISNK